MELASLLLILIALFFGVLILWVAWNILAFFVVGVFALVVSIAESVPLWLWVAAGFAFVWILTVIY